MLLNFEASRARQSCQTDFRKELMTRSPSRIPRRTSRRRELRLLLFAAIPLFLVFTPERHARGAPGTGAAPCPAAADKWRWHSLFDDYLPPFWDWKPALETETSPASCLNCLLWADDPLAAPLYTRTHRESMSLNQARCLQTLGMQAEALRAYWQIVSGNPDEETRAVCTDAILGILFDYGSLEAVIGLYRSLPAAQQDRLSAEGLYRVAQSLYRKNRDQEAEPVLLEIPKDSEVFPYALYEQAQVAFRHGDADQALTFLQAIVELPSDLPVPEVLRETSQLTRARLLFQQGRYEEAIEGFRRLGGSRLFLPDAIMGLGWCHHALDQPSLAISYFGTMEQAAGADAAAWARASLEMAHLYSKAGMQEQAFGIFQVVQERLESLITHYREADRTPELLERLSGQLFSLPAPAEDAPAPGSQNVRDRDAEVEMRLFLERETHTSQPLKELLARWKDLGQVEARVASRSAGQPPEGGEDALFRYPPLSPPLPVLDPEMVRLLDASLRLLDAESRLDQTESLLDPVSPQERPAVGKARTVFYRSLFYESFAPAQSGREPMEFLRRMQSAIRNLPFPLEVRRQILTKILSLRKNLEEVEQTLQRWDAGLEPFSRQEGAPPRLLMLQRWMALVRTLVQLRTWADQPPAVCLLQTLAPSGAPESASAGKRVMREKLAARVGEVRQRLQALMREQIRRTNERTAKDFEAILVRSQLYQAEALLHQQEELLGAMQGSPEE